MRLDLVNHIRANPNLYHYLKYHSYWYKELIRNPLLVKELDKINKINDQINLIASFLDIIK